MKSGYGSKGFSKSSVESLGIKTYAQNFGSPRSAFLSIIPYTANLHVWSSFEPSSYASTTSGSTTVINSWTDIINQKAITQSTTSSMPTLSFPISNKSGLRFVSDDWLFGTPDSTASAASGSDGWYMTYGIHMRTEQNHALTSSVNNYFMLIPHGQASLWTNEWFFGFTFWQEGGGNRRYVFRTTIQTFGGNRALFLFSPNIGSFTATINVENYLKDYIYYFTIGSTADRKLMWQIADKYGNALYSTSSAYDNSAMWGAGVTTSSWDTTFGGPGGAKLPTFRPTTGRSAADNTYYTSIQFGSTVAPDANILKKTTQYLESIYGVM